MMEYKTSNLGLDVLDYPSCSYRNRDERNRFVAQVLRGYIGSAVLSVGGGGFRYLEGHLPAGTRYTEVDLSGTPDVVVDLERDLPLPFQDGAFDTVICTDVLEHLDNLHDVFAELVRLSSGIIIISLPNAARSLPRYLLKRPKGVWRGGVPKYSKYYGLPFTRPDDRHKWFFSYVEAMAFYVGMAQRYDLQIERRFSVGCFSANKAIASIQRVIAAHLFGAAWHNALCTAAWVVYRRKAL